MQGVHMSYKLYILREKCGNTHHSSYSVGQYTAPLKRSVRRELARCVYHCCELMLSQYHNIGLASDLCSNTGHSMGLLPDAQNCGLRMRRECRGRFPRHRLQSQPQVSDPGMCHGTCVTHVPCCMSGSLTHGGGENVPGACASRNFTYLVRGPWSVHMLTSATNATGNMWKKCNLTRLGFKIKITSIHELNCTGYLKTLVPEAGIKRRVSNYIPQLTVGYNYVCIPGYLLTRVLIWQTIVRNMRFLVNMQWGMCLTK